MENAIKITYNYLNKIGYYLDDDGDVCINSHKINTYKKNCDGNKLCDIYVDCYENGSPKRYKCTIQYSRLVFMLRHKIDIPTGYLVRRIKDDEFQLGMFKDIDNTICFQKYYDGDKKGVMVLFTPYLKYIFNKINI